MKKQKSGFCSSKAIANRIAEKRTVRKDAAYRSRSGKTTQINEFRIYTMGGALVLIRERYLTQPVKL